MTSQKEARFPCAQCGAQLRFAPQTRELTCDHCGHRQATPATDFSSQAKALQEIPLDRGRAESRKDRLETDVRTSHCTSCGAVVEMNGGIFSAECPFCASPVVADPASLRRIPPQALVPFALTQDQARQALTEWLGSLWFAPNNLLEFTRKGRTMTGIYVPFWTFDAATQSQYTGQRGEHYYETRSVNVVVNGKSETRQEQVQKTKWYPVSGRVSRDFDDVLVMAARSLPTKLGDDLTPWDLTALVPYSPDYLSGFSAEVNVIPLEEGHDDARNRMTQGIQGDVRADIGGDVQKIDHLSTDWKDETFKHVLLPIWTAAYKYRGKSFQFLVNGQTGEVQGERPYSFWKIFLTILLVAMLIMGAIYLNDPNVFGAEWNYQNPKSRLPDWLLTPIRSD